MAAFTSTVTEKRENANMPVNSNNVYVRTLTYTIPAGTVAGSTLDTIVIPAGTYIVDILDKASVTLANSATIVYSLGAGSAIAPAAVRTGSTSMTQIGTITKANAIANADTTLRVTTATGTIDNASTVTVSVLACTIDTASAPYSTFTN